jgi:hypothetical protein
VHLGAGTWRLVLAVVLALSAAACTPGDPRVGTWYDGDGSPVPDGRPLVLSVEAGSDHCSWQRVVFMTMAWPLSEPVRGPSMSDPRTRIYVWEPDGAYPLSSLTMKPREVGSMPANARYTGLHRGSWQLWISHSMLDTAVYVTDGETIQAWARVARFVGCE